jgi:hypothetical protein
LHRRTRLTVSILATAAAGLLAALPAAAVETLDQERCASSEANPYVGTYQWRGGGPAEPVRLWFDRTEQIGNSALTAVGRAVYLAAPPTRITICATIDLKRGRIEIWESDPDHAPFETKGSHVGAISADHCRIEAVWTTRGTGAQGDLILEMKRR